MGEIIPWAPAYPYIPSNPRKQLFINYRIAGHTEREAMLLVGVKERALYKWKQLDKDFAYWNSDGIEQLRKESREKLVGDLFAINAHMVEQIDQVFLRRISAKINKGVVLTQEEQKQLDKLRNLYAMPTHSNSSSAMCSCAYIFSRSSSVIQTL